MELSPEENDEVGRQVSTWLRRMHSQGSAALREMRNWDKAKLRETLDWIQANVPSRERRANLISVETAIIEELRERRANPRDRHFLKFLYGHKDACHLLLRNVLRDPEVYSKHPEPEVGAAIMVCDKFRPQLQAILCNYSKAAQELDLSTALRDELWDCRCSQTLWKPDPGCTNEEGHVLMSDTRNLRWPFLRTMVQRGRKFRLETDTDQIFADLRLSLDSYVSWCARGNHARLASGLKRFTMAAGRIGPERCSSTPSTTQCLKATPA